MSYGRLNYFAFVSLTTVGYGDLTPVIPAIRLACMALSVLGPLYLAIVLGMLSSRFSATDGQVCLKRLEPQASARPRPPAPSSPSLAPEQPGPGLDASEP